MQHRVPWMPQSRIAVQLPPCITHSDDTRTVYCSDPVSSSSKYAVYSVTLPLCRHKTCLSWLDYAMTLAKEGLRGIFSNGYMYLIVGHKLMDQLPVHMCHHAPSQSILGSVSGVSHCTDRQGLYQLVHRAAMGYITLVGLWRYAVVPHVPRCRRHHLYRCHRGHRHFCVCPCTCIFPRGMHSICVL